MSVEIRTVEQVKCKNCGSEAVVKYGSYKGVPCFLCKSCNRKFKADDNLAGMRVPTKEIASALNLYYDGSSVRAIGRHFQQETGHTPSIASIYEWIQKYSQYLTESIKDYHPNVGDEWIADETVLTIEGKKVWLWDLIDEKTRYLLASRLSVSRTTQDAQILIDRAIKTAGKKPKTVLTDQLASYLDVSYGKDAEHIQGSPFSTIKGESTSKLERWHGTLKARTKVMRGLKNHVSAHRKGFSWSYGIRKPKDYMVKQRGDLVQLDTLDIRPLLGVVLKHFTTHDVVSRWNVIGVYPRSTATNAVHFLNALERRMPFPLRAIQVDGGSEFEALFEEECKRREIKLFVLSPRSPKLNGGVERAHRTHTEEFYEVTDSTFEIADLGEELLEWERIYNTVRPHQALGYLTPLKFLEKQRKEVRCH